MRLVALLRLRTAPWQLLLISAGLERRHESGGIVTQAADDSFIRKGGHGGAASFPLIKSPWGDEPWIELITHVWGSIERPFLEGNQFVLSSRDDALQVL